MINGLKPKIWDLRDITLGQVITLPKLEELPKKFILEPLSIKNQVDYLGNNSDFCTDFSACLASEMQENIELIPGFTFAILKNGDSSWGANLKDIAKAHCKYGALDKNDAPFSFENKTAEFIRDIKNYPADSYNKALKHRKKAYIDVSSYQYDAFDTIRAFIWHFRNEKRAVLVGGIFGWQLSSMFMTEYIKQGFGHALTAIGWSDDWLIIANSYSKEAGENGRHYFSRKVINEMYNSYGAIAFIDMSVEDLKKEYWTLTQRLLDLMYKWVESIKKQFEISQQTEQLKKEKEIIESISDEIPPEAKEKYLWDTKENARHSVRLICDEERLSLVDKNLICAVINCESEFNVKAIHKNNDKRKTIDYGICQFNDYWYKDLITPDEALNNPEKTVRLMIQQFKKGRLNDWICYKSGKYKSYE